MLYLFSIRGHQESIGTTWMIKVMHGCCCIKRHQLQCRKVSSHDAIVLWDKAVGSVCQTPLSIVYICLDRWELYEILCNLWFINLCQHFLKLRGNLIIIKCRKYQIWPHKIQFLHICQPSYKTISKYTVTDTHIESITLSLITPQKQLQFH